MDENAAHDRPNLAMAAVVDQGIQIERQEGRAAAVKFLASVGVPDRVIARVLIERILRRKIFL
ncbi:MAG: hypothetical protein V4724_39865 [Pseudomonadota bacterium]